MKKKQRNILISVIIGLVLISLIMSNGMLPLSLSGGSTYLNIQDASVDGQNRVIVNAVVGTGAEKLKINWDANKLSKELKYDGYKATNGVDGYISLDSQIKEFSITKKSEYFYEYRLKDIGTFKGESDCVSYGKSYFPDYSYYSSRMSQISTRMCIFRRNVGRNSVFSGLFYDDTTVNVDIGGETGSIRPKSGSNSLTLSRGTLVQWTGNLNNYLQIYTPSAYSVLFSNSKFVKLINSDTYSQAENARSQYITSGSCATTNNYYTLRDCISNYNTKVGTLLLSKTDEYMNSVPASTSSFDDSSFKVDLDVATVLPTFRIILDADKVGLERLSGMPSISCPSSQELKSGDSKFLTFGVTNIGDQAGSFLGKVSCSGVDANGVVFEKYVGKNNAEDMNMQLSGSNTEEGTKSGTCKLEVYDSNKPENSDSCSFGASVSYQGNIACQPPSSVKCISENILRQCSSDGSNFTDVACQGGCENDKCIGGGQDILGKCADCDAYALNRLLGWANDDLKCDRTFTQNQTICLFSIIKLILLPIVLILSSLVFNNYLQRFLKLDKRLNGLLAFIGGFLLSVLVYFSFMIGIVLFAVFFLLQLFLPTKYYRRFKSIKSRLGK